MLMYNGDSKEIAVSGFYLGTPCSWTFLILKIPSTKTLISEINGATKYDHDTKNMFTHKITQCTYNHIKQEQSNTINIPLEKVVFNCIGTILLKSSFNKEAVHLSKIVLF